MAQVSDPGTEAAQAPSRRRYVARVVPANFRKYRGRGAEATFTVR